MRVDVFHPRKIPFVYVSPPFCEFIFSASGEVDIFLNTRNRRGLITGYTMNFIDGVYRLSWDTFPGALCYSVYKLVDELDPYSNYVLVAECITDNFIDLTDPGAYVVTAVDVDGETPFPEEPFIVSIPSGPDPCEGNQPPSGTGIEVDACKNAINMIDVSGANVDPDGYALEITAASADVGAVTFSGMTLTYTPPIDFYGDAQISYTVVDPCGASIANAVLVNVWDEPVFDVPDLTTCDDTPLDIDVGTLITVGDSQAFTISEASVDTGGSVSFDGTVITFTPEADFSGSVVVSYTVVGECGAAYSSTANVEVECVLCTLPSFGHPWVVNQLLSDSSGGETSSFTASGKSASWFASVSAGMGTRSTFMQADTLVINNTTGAPCTCQITTQMNFASNGYATVNVIMTGAGVNPAEVGNIVYNAAGTFTRDYTVPVGGTLRVQIGVYAGSLGLFPFVVAGSCGGSVQIGEVP